MLSEYSTTQFYKKILQPDFVIQAQKPHISGHRYNENIPVNRPSEEIHIVYEAPIIEG